MYVVSKLPQRGKMDVEKEDMKAAAQDMELDEDMWSIDCDKKSKRRIQVKTMPQTR